MIKIYSGWTNPGGSTTAFINLTNALNESGFDTIFYGPHDWHLNRCRSEKTNGKMTLSPDDIVIIHFIDKLQYRPPIKKLILSCHEQDIFPIRNLNYAIFDKIHYVSEHQKNFHNVNHPYFISSNVLDNLIKSNNQLPYKIGGIVGSIDNNKQVHVSIQRALDDGCQKIYMYGNISDPNYWESTIKPLISKYPSIEYRGFADNKQAMYDSFSDLYFSSINECAPYVIAEAKLTGKVIHGIDGKNYLNTPYEFDKNKIIQTWIKEVQ